MLFNSVHFALFLPIVIVVVGLLRGRAAQHAFLLAASCYFYAVFSSYALIFLFLVSALNFYCGGAIAAARGKRQAKIYLVVSLIANLGVLGYFKYTNFAINVVLQMLESAGLATTPPALEILLPIGISFYTFHGMSYTIDVYFDRMRSIASLREFSLYMTFFPLLVAGPIVRAKVFLPQLRAPVVLDPENFRLGLPLIGTGLVKKIVVADNLAPFVQTTLLSGGLPADTLLIIAGTVAFAVQIYCDFSGYTDIAIGASRLLGFQFPDNFNFPYFARNVSEFWQRWHISLSSWLRDYLYIPLGGSRHGRGRMIFALMTTMVLGGLWHGAAWNFVIWGFYQGFLLVAHKTLVPKPAQAASRWNFLKIGFTFYLTCIGWLIFLIPDPSRIVHCLRRMLFLDFSTAGWSAFWTAHSFPIGLLAGFFLVHVASYKFGRLSRVLARQSWPALTGTLAGSCVALYLFAKGQNSFIYFQF